MWGKEKNTETRSRVTDDDGIVRESTLRYTKDFDRFVLMRGNRKVVEKHVQSLMRRMQEQGNLTTHFPIIVNERMEVIDGQHRLEALRRLSESNTKNPEGETVWTPFYRIETGLSVEAVRDINNGHRNWTWQDYLTSYISEDKEQYERFKNLIDHFKLSFSTILYYVCGEDKGRTRAFKEGDLMIRDHQRAFQLLKWYREIVDVSSHDNQTFSIVLHQVMQHPEYDHKRMVRKMGLYHTVLKKFVTRPDYLRAIEDIYNRGQSEETKVRLF